MLLQKIANKAVSGGLSRESFEPVLALLLFLAVVGRPAGRSPVWSRSSRLLALAAISCKIYRHCRNINSAGRELELVALTKTNLSRDQVMPTKRAEIAPRYPTPALEKGLDILELLVNHPMGLTKSEVARSLARTVSEIFRMLVCLEERGYISQSRD